MKRMIVLLAVAVSLFGCASTQYNAPTVADVSKRVCPSVQAVMASLQLVDTVTPEFKDKLHEVEPVVAIACSTQVAASVEDFHALANQALPVVLKLISNSSMSDDEKQTATVAVIIAQAVIATVR